MSARLVLLCPECRSLVEIANECCFCGETLLWSECSGCEEFIQADSEVCPFCEEEQDDGEGVSLVCCPSCESYEDVDLEDPYCSECSSSYAGIECPNCGEFVYHDEDCSECGYYLPDYGYDEDNEEDEEFEEPEVEISDPRLTSIAGRLLGDCNTQVEVIEGRSINGFADGNKIKLTRGAVEKLDDEELSYIIAHEAGHNHFKHPQSAGERNIANMEALESGPLVAGALFVANRFIDRQRESLVDELAVELMKEAGFDPSKAISALEKIEQQEINIVPEFLRSHPKTSKRREKIRRQING